MLRFNLFEMKNIFIITAAFSYTLAAQPVMSQRGYSPSPYYCDRMASNYAERYGSGGEVLGGVAGGSALGAIIGGIVDGRSGAAAGAIAGGLIGGVGGGAREQENKRRAYDRAYRECMSGYRYRRY